MNSNTNSFRPVIGGLENQNPNQQNTIQNTNIQNNQNNNNNFPTTDNNNSSTGLVKGKK